MEGYPILVLSPVIAMAANVGIHIGINHARRGRNPMMNLLAAFAAGGLGLLVINVAILVANWGERVDCFFFLALNVATYGAVGFCYFAFINLNLASLRIRIVREIRSASGGSLTLEEILERYDARAVVDARLDRLVDGGQFARKGKVFVSGPNPVFRRLAWVMDFLKTVILGGRRV